MQKIADVVGPKVFVSYISKLTAEQKKIYDDLSESRARVEDRLGSDIFLRQINKNFVVAASMLLRIWG